MLQKPIEQPENQKHAAEDLYAEIANLEGKASDLQKQAMEYEQAAFRAQLQKDIYEKASEFI